MGPSKLAMLSDLRPLARPGETVGIGGGPIQITPMALIRELVRSGVKGLHLVASSTGGLGLDLLIGAGAAASVEFAQIILNEYGPAPNFRRWAESGRLTCKDHS